MGTFQIILIVLNFIQLWGFFVAIFARSSDAGMKTAGIVFGMIASLNLFFIFTHL